MSRISPIPLSRSVITRQAAPCTKQFPLSRNVRANTSGRFAKCTSTTARSSSASRCRNSAASSQGPRRRIPARAQKAAAMKVSRDSDSPVLILAPTGRDAILAADALTQSGIASQICGSLGGLCAQIGEGAAAVLLAEEALSAADLPELLSCLHAQPAWSDLPLLILTSATQQDDLASIEILKLFGPSGNVTLLERPLRSVVLVSTVQVALRARRRQYEVRDLLAERETVLTSISDAFSALDRDWRYIYVNDKVAELAGWPKEKMLGRVIWEIFAEAVG